MDRGTPRTHRTSRVVAVAMALLLAAIGAAAATASATRESGGKAVLAALAMDIENAPNPVRAVDGKRHLAYEIAIVNQSSSDVRLDRVQPRSHGTPFGPALDGQQLKNLLRVNGGRSGRTIPAGGSATLFMDVTYRRAAATPKRLRHGFRTTLLNKGDDQPNNYVGVPTRVGRRSAIEVRPPLRGDDWVVGNGCCNPINAHRGATLSINGTVRTAQRFAIDFVRLNDQGRLYDGPKNELSSYAYYGKRIRSVSAGKVVRVQDNQPEQVPGSLPEGQTVETADGNYVVIRIDRGHYAFYAHMQLGSLRVSVGDRVRPGQVLGRLGNTGNTDAPHLHFHIMDGPSPLESNGLPFVYDSFRGQGFVTNGDDVQDGAVAKVNHRKYAGRFRDRMPLGFQLIDFGR